MSNIGILWDVISSKESLERLNKIGELGNGLAHNRCELRKSEAKARCEELEIEKKELENRLLKIEIEKKEAELRKYQKNND